MPFRSGGTRRAGRLALLWCALLWGAAETGGALAPPCAEATPYTLTTTAIKPVGDPDTPDEGPHPVKLVSGGPTVTLATAPATSTSWSRTGSNLWEWLFSLVDLFVLE